MRIIPCSTNMESAHSSFEGVFIFILYSCSKLYSTRGCRLDMRWLQPTRRWAHPWLSVNSWYATRARGIINNYWMRLSMISWMIKTEVCVICLSRRLRRITQTRGFDNSWYHAKTEFNNCFIIHFSHNSSSETEAKRSATFFPEENTHR